MMVAWVLRGATAAVSSRGRDATLNFWNLPFVCSTVGRLPNWRSRPSRMDEFRDDAIFIVELEGKEEEPICSMVILK